MHTEGQLAVEPSADRLGARRTCLGGGQRQRQGVQLHVLLAEALGGDGDPAEALGGLGLGGEQLDEEEGALLAFEVPVGRAGSRLVSMSAGSLGDRRRQGEPA